MASFVDFLHAALVAPAFERGIQPFVQDVDSLLFTHKLRRQHQDVRIPMLARQLSYLLIPCQRRTHVGIAVGRVRHAQTCTTSEHPPLHFSTTHSLGDRLGIVGIVVRRVELFGAHVDGLVPKLLELVYQPVLEVEPDVVGSNKDLLSHRSFPPLLPRKPRACHPERSARNARRARDLLSYARARSEGPFASAAGAKNLLFGSASEAGPSLRALRALRSGSQRRRSRDRRRE